MKKTSLDELITGGKLYEERQLKKPIKIFILNHYYILCYSDGIAVLNKTDLLKSKTKILSNFVTNKQFLYTDISTTLSINLQHPTLYHYEEKNETIKLWFIENSTVTSLLYHLCHKNFSLCFNTKLPTLPLYAKANSKGDLAFTNNDNTLFILSREGNLRECYHSPLNQRIDITPSRSEFGIIEELFWSPDDSQIAFYQTDNCKVMEYPLVKLYEPSPCIEMIKYPKPGMPSEKVSIGIIQTDSLKLSIIDPSKDPSIIDAKKTIDHNNSYLPCLTWSPDSKHILLCELERSQKYFQVKKYCASTGLYEDFLFDEDDEKYVEPEHPFNFIDGKNFVYLSQRSGHNHAYQFNLTSKKTRTLTGGDWDILKIVGYNAKDNAIIYLSTEESPLSKDPYSLNLSSLKTTKLFNESGTHHLYFDPKCTFFIDLFSSTNQQEKIIFPEYAFEVYSKGSSTSYKREIGTFSSRGEYIYYRATYPKKSRRKKMPIVFYVYGGPHVQLITNDYGSGTKGFEEMMAQDGYFVFCIDPRGSANRGRKFEEAIYQNINQPQIEDYDNALDWLFSVSNYKEHINSNEIFIYGWSFGGYMTISMLLNSRHKFKLGIAGGAVVDWRLYETMYTERYLGVRNPKSEEIYKRFDLREQLHHLSSPLYLIHCDNDPVVLIQHTLSLLKTANSQTQNSHLIDYYIYPGHAHNVIGIERVELMKKIKYLINKSLKNR